MSAKAQQLVNAAIALFDERGYRATGIDAILERAGVAKMTLYKHFATKDDLIVAAIRAASERTRSQMIAEIERRATDPRARLLVWFDIAHELVVSNEFRGCLFIRATGEFSGDADGGIRAACAEHSAAMTRYVTGLAVQAGAADPAGLADQLMVLFKGVLAAGQGGTAEGVITSAKAAAATLIDAGLGSAHNAA